MNPTLQTLGQSVDHWQIIYIVSISFALVSTFAMVYFAFHREHPTGLRASNYFYVAASFLAVLSTIVIVNKTKSIDAIKDTVVAKATTDAKEADRKAQEARTAAAQVEQENLKLQAQVLTLQGQVLRETGRATNAEAGLAKANKETSDFAHSLQQQQVTMQEQAKLSPQLTDFQIQQFAAILKPYAGTQVDINQTAETVVGRLASQIHAAFNIAGIKTNHSTMMGALYQGVSVGVHDPKDVPPIANALVVGLRQAGIEVHPVAAPDQVKAGGVSIFIGPN